MNKPRSKAVKNESEEECAPWMVCTFPVALRLQFVAACMQNKTTVSATLERLIRKELQQKASR
jgi:hypothetical protein